MNENQKNLLYSFLDSINKDYYEMFLELAQYAISLGYTPRRNKTQDFSIDFTKNKFKTSIMKMEIQEQKHGRYGYGERNIPGLRLKYYASTDYSEIFRNGIKNVIEEFDGKYTGCYGCGRCKNQLEGYTYVYPGGKRVFRCGRELISIFDFSIDSLNEIKELIKGRMSSFQIRIANVKRL